MKKRENLAKAIYDIGKLVFAVLVLGPIVTPEAFSVAIFSAGIIFTVVTFVSAYVIDRGD